MSDPTKPQVQLMTLRRKRAHQLAKKYDKPIFVSISQINQSGNNTEIDLKIDLVINTQIDLKTNISIDLRDIKDQHLRSISGFRDG